jgi:two-component system OmpR family sensor kinase
MNGQPVGPTQYTLVLSHDNGVTPQVIESGNLPAPALNPLTQAQAQATNQKAFTVGSVSGDGRWRVVALPVSYGFAAGTGSAQIALPLSIVSKPVHRLTLLVIAFGLLVTAVASLLGWLAIRRAFVPLTEVEQTAAAIAEGDLSRRVPTHPESTEVGRLTSALNGMLAQIESAFRSREASEQRTRRFAADASHELRTPLASIRGFAELYRQGAVREPEDVARTMSRIEGESKRMGTLVEDLLLLARLDEQRPARTDPVDLAVLAGDAAHDARGLDPGRTVRLTGLMPGRGPEPTVVIGDENRLRQVVANLVGNAVRHTPPGTPVEIAAGTQNGVAVIEVRDHGPGLPPEHAARVFERFYRVDSSRTRGQGGGSGLGLSIVAAVVSAHGGRVGVAQTPGGGATFRVELPLARDLPAVPEPEDDAEALDPSEPVD